jgi:hypothetical protein
MGALVASVRTITINGTGHDSLFMTRAARMEMTVTSFPVFVIFPDLTNISAAIDRSSGNALIPSDTLAVYFSSPTSLGRIVLTATFPTTLTYFTVKSPFQCSRYFLSTAPIQQWQFGPSETGDICLVHVSDAPTTTIDGSCHTSEGVYDGSGRRISGSGTHFWVLRLRTESAGSCSVRLSSKSSLPHKSAEISPASSAPIIMPLTKSRTRTRSPSPTPSRTRSSSPSPTGSYTPSPTHSESPTPTETHSPSPTGSESPRPSRSQSPTESRRASMEEGAKGEAGGGIGAGAIAGIVIGAVAAAALGCFLLTREGRLMLRRSPFAEPILLEVATDEREDL